MVNVASGTSGLSKLVPRVVSIGSSVVDDLLVKGEASVTRDTARLPNSPNVSSKEEARSGFTPRRALEKANDHANYTSFPEKQ